MKAGLMEIGEIFVVNKADREGAEMTVEEISSMLLLKDQSDGWAPPVLLTTATIGRGIPELAPSRASSTSVWAAGRSSTSLWGT